MIEVKLKTTDDYINRQVAIEALRYVQHKFTLADETNGMGTVKWDENIIYFSEAERVLMNLPSIQSQINYEDVINRQAAINALMEKEKKLRNINWYDKPYAEDECRGIDEALSIISDLPSAQPEAIVRCKDCKHRYGDDCPMRIAIEVKVDDDGYIDHEILHHDNTIDDGYCDYAERRN